MQANKNKLSGLTSPEGRMQYFNSRIAFIKNENGAILIVTKCNP